MKINLVVVGKLRKEFFLMFEKYLKRISLIAQLNIIEVKECTHENIEIKKSKETESILKVIPKTSEVFLCSLEGKEYSSNEFANFFERDNLTFVIGGSNGVIETSFKNKINFSKLTFPHQLFRVMLIEQIYRGLSIKNNLKYHK